MYRIVHKDGKVLGGPMVYLEHAFKDQYPRFAWVGRGLGVIFATFTILASLGGGNMFQGNQTFELLVNQLPFFSDLGIYVGIVWAILVSIVVIGGIKRIGEVTSRLVPFMCAFIV